MKANWSFLNEPFTIPASELRSAFGQQPQPSYAEQQFREAVKAIASATAMDEQTAAVWAARLAQRIVEHAASGGVVEFTNGEQRKKLKVPIPVAPWASALGLLRSTGVSEREVLDAFRAKAKTAHPDAGGTHEEFLAISKARDEGLKSVRESTNEKPPPW